jgi:hypothetical protein
MLIKPKASLGFKQEEPGEKVAFGKGAFMYRERYTACGGGVSINQTHLL